MGPHLAVADPGEDAEVRAGVDGGAGGAVDGDRGGAHGAGLAQQADGDVVGPGAVQHHHRVVLGQRVAQGVQGHGAAGVQPGGHPDALQAHGQLAQRHRVAPLAVQVHPLGRGDHRGGLLDRGEIDAGDRVA